VDDGSSDETQSALDRYRGTTIVILRQENQGLSRASQRVAQARGEYVIRLDADDWLTKTSFSCSTMSWIPTRLCNGLHDYYRTNEEGEVLEQVVLARSTRIVCSTCRHEHRDHDSKCVWWSLAATTRTSAARTNYDLWIRFIRIQACNINLPLWYYRQRASSLTTLPGRIFKTRRRIKAEFVKHRFAPPSGSGHSAGATSEQHIPDFPLMKLNGKRIIEHTLDEALAVEAIKKVVVSTDHPGLMVLSCVTTTPGGMQRTIQANGSGKRGYSATLQDVLDRYGGHTYDAVALLHVHCHCACRPYPGGDRHSSHLPGRFRGLGG